MRDTAAPGLIVPGSTQHGRVSRSWRRRKTTNTARDSRHELRSALCGVESELDPRPGMGRNRQLTCQKVSCQPDRKRALEIMRRLKVRLDKAYVIADEEKAAWSRAGGDTREFYRTKTQAHPSGCNFKERAPGRTEPATGTSATA